MDKANDFDLVVATRVVKGNGEGRVPSLLGWNGFGGAEIAPIDFQLESAFPLQILTVEAAFALPAATLHLPFPANYAVRRSTDSFVLPYSCLCGV